MPVKRLEAAPVKALLEKNLASRIAALKGLGITPRLDVILVGDDPASSVYVSKKIEAGKAIGVTGELHRFPASATVTEVESRVESLNADRAVHGILIQRPLPSQFNDADIDMWVLPEKDVDCFHPVNVGLLQVGTPFFAPCTPAGIVSLLDFYKINVAGKLACVLGRSLIVGKPIAALLLQRDATVLHCHSKTKQLAKLTKLADLVVVAVGKKGFLKANMVKKGAVVIDVGIHRDAKGKLSGDAAADVAKVAGALTPVPGGVGPMTITTLLSNAVKAAEIASNLG